MGRTKPEEHRYDISRRSLLRTGALTVAGAALAPLTGCERCEPSGAGGLTELTFSFGPDESGTLEPMVDEFNREHEGRIRVRLRQMARESDAYFRQLESAFATDDPGIHVIGADVVWTAMLADRGWVRDLRTWFFDAFQPEDFLEPALNSAAWRFRVWGVPWFTDAGMLFYRRDLLEAAGLERPPATWTELTEVCQRITGREGGPPEGYLFQGAEYEGGVANALEFIWNAGGRVLTDNLTVAGAFGQNLMDPNIITVNTEQAAAGLDAARRLITGGAAPEAVASYHEVEALREFEAGNAAFLRHWPAALGLMAGGESAVDPDQVGVAPLPGSEALDRRYSCLGGWNLMISSAANRAQREAAWTFIQHLVSPEQQRRRATEGGYLPTLRSLYDDEELLEAVPIMARGREALRHARIRPPSPVYMQLAPRISHTFNQVLRGRVEGTRAVATLQDELREILRRNR